MVNTEPIELRHLDDALETVSLTLDPDGRPVVPAIFVNLDSGISDQDTVARLRRLKSQVIAIGLSQGDPTPYLGDLVDALTFTLCGSDVPQARQFVVVSELDEERARIAEAIERNPRAALTLIGVLNLNESVSVSDGIIAESTAYSMLLASTEFESWRLEHPARPIPQTSRPAVTLRRRGATLCATLDRPERRNSFSREMRDGLIEALDTGYYDESIELLEIDGNGPCFCSGGDLDEFGTIADVSLAHLIRLDRSVGLRIHEQRHRTHVRVHGSCIGAGIEIPAFADNVSADAATVFQLPELRMGLIPGAGGTVSITRRIGRWRTAYLALSGTRIDASTALSWGLIDEIQPSNRTA